MKKEMIVSVFGSSRPRENDPEYAEARELGRVLAKKGFAICTGGYAGPWKRCREVRKKLAARLTV